MRSQLPEDGFKDRLLTGLKKEMARRKHAQCEPAGCVISPSLQACAAALVVLKPAKRGNRTRQRRLWIAYVRIAKLHVSADHGQQQLHQLSIFKHFPWSTFITPQYLDEFLIGNFARIEIIYLFRTALCRNKKMYRQRGAFSS